jgi:hypothetical protein
MPAKPKPDPFTDICNGIRDRVADELSNGVRQVIDAYLPPKTSISTDLELDILNAGYRELAKTRHPDVGGSTAQMQQLNEAYVRLKRKLG